MASAQLYSIHRNRNDINMHLKMYMLNKYATKGNYIPDTQCWESYFVKVTSYILLATELFSYSYILPIK